MASRGVAQTAARPDSVFYVTAIGQIESCQVWKRSVCCQCVWHAKQRERESERKRERESERERRMDFFPICTSLHLFSRSSYNLLADARRWRSLLQILASVRKRLEIRKCKLCSKLSVILAEADATVQSIGYRNRHVPNLASILRSRDGVCVELPSRCDVQVSATSARVVLAHVSACDVGLCMV